jgi:integrase
VVEKSNEISKCPRVTAKKRGELASLCPLGWRRREITRLEWKYIEENILRLPPELPKSKDGRVLVLMGVLAEIIERRRQARLGLIPWVFHHKGKPIKDFSRAWDNACEAAGVSDGFFHDFRRTAVRNLTCAGVPEKIAMSIMGHKTRAVFDCYNIVNEEDSRRGLEQTFDHLSDRHRQVTPFFSAKIGYKTDV